ncbi:hypothetical protein OJF2_55090 [Aquisphaera giovannonii]|uniref:Glycosyltransferase RgtA/B/C/D-like domain-containing protein n=1 Tax=Aquisphaera giovannonii TaxID=406548 RepID=A0A5B9W9I3_9BACT|nr:hypothetical protein [Aquisphaera giovannonii]QEH36924.1 hypothetical protein OJF2_55090 [Aquisphaera giovannonii]
MKETGPASTSTLFSARGLAVTAMAGLIGLLMAHWPMLITGFRRLQTDPGDTRLIHYLLEHGYRWLAGEPHHRDFWNAPFFYPAKNVAAYSDTLLGVMPFYALFRGLGAGADLAFGLWLVEMSVLNYAAALLLFRRGFELGLPSSVAAAYLVAFGSPRMEQLGHAQLLPCFYLTLSLLALAVLFRHPPPGHSRRFLLWGAASLGFAAQLYSGVYLGWYFAITLGIGTFVALGFRGSRGPLLRVAIRDSPSSSSPESRPDACSGRSRPIIASRRKRGASTSPS